MLSTTYRAQVVAVTAISSLYLLRSDPIRIGQNAVAGNSLITVTWTDTISGQTAESVVALEIYSYPDYQKGLNDGSINPQGDSSTLAEAIESSTTDTSSNTSSTCRIVTIAEEASEDYSTSISATFSQSYEELYEQFLKNYSTAKNWLRVYGGASEPSTDSGVRDTGEVTIEFSRPIVFPTQLLQEFDQEYQEVVPVLEPTQGEKDELKKIYDET